ncbi:Spore coat protein U (SCPU) domain-containing protein [Sphingopyxis sp. YR583]|uniref:Csu type fimbrial protein n=1 Tax=Sphingopyxis sp. YR583 TaxID=1881047 RepID=UPI0008A7AAF4|nr:spore coat U domain-containing protein [Sphingopyxis sp. YR583]SEH12500.1 Spore coat protein U (SCPU) domain-containing protein [Sphingopyxis sp. YR583]
MTYKFSKALTAGFAIAAMSVAPSAHADITGTIDATITLEAGCIINGQNLDDSATGADFGTIDFGTENTLFVQSDAEVLNGGGALSIQCSPGITPILSFEAGENDGEGSGVGLRAMAHSGTPGQFVTYNLYADSGRSTLIPIGGDIVLASTGAVQTVNVYGRAFGEAGLIPGTYSDTVTVVLEL